MALSDKFILQEMKNGNIIIDPFAQDDLSTSSYDLRLGEWYYREQHPNVEAQAKNPRLRFFNPYSKRDTHRIWGDPIQAKSLKEILPELLTTSQSFDEAEEGISADDLIIVIDPGETLLAHTLEFIGGINHLTTSMQTRSSHGRSCIGVCKCAGWGDVGYINRWTMEITNFSRYYSILLVVGRRYAQMVFDPTGEILDKAYGESGKYQSGNSIAEIKKQWKPEMMLPRLFNDRDRIRKK